MELNWNNAELWVENANEDEEYPHPMWSFDCGFKLDFDGSLVNVSSRFYPPHKNDGIHWNGDVQIYFFDNMLAKKNFKNTDLNKLKDEVLIFIEEVKVVLRDKLKDFQL